MAATFTFCLDEEILDEAYEIERRKDAEQQKEEAEKTRAIAEEQARLKAAEEEHQAKLRIEAEALAAVEAERLAKGRAIEEARQHEEAARRTKEKATEAARQARFQAEADALRQAAEEASAKQLALATRLAKEAADKAAKNKTMQAVPTNPKAPTAAQAQGEVSAQRSPWGGASEIPETPQVTPKKVPTSNLFKTTPPPAEAVPEACKPAPKKSGLLGSAFTKRSNDSA